MQIFERAEDLKGGLNYGFFVELLIRRRFQLPLQRLALHILHHEEVAVAVAQAVVDADDVFMFEARQHVGLALEGRGGRLPLRQIGKAVDHFG